MDGLSNKMKMELSDGILEKSKQAASKTAMDGAEEARISLAPLSKLEKTNVVADKSSLIVLDNSELQLRRAQRDDTTLQLGKSSIKDDFKVFADETDGSSSFGQSTVHMVSERNSLEWTSEASSSVPSKRGKMEDMQMAENVSDSICGTGNLFYSSPIYCEDIYKYQTFREKNEVGRSRSNYMAKQKELDSGMRSTLVDWFVDVCSEYDLSSETFFLSVYLVDRTLSSVEVSRKKLQLVGAAAVFIASKVEEVTPPTLSDMVFVTEDGFNEQQILRMESIILRVVDFELHVPLVDNFASFYALFQPISDKANCLMWYLLELSCMHDECLRFKPTLLAAAAYALSVFATSALTRSDDTTPDAVETLGPAFNTRKRKHSLQHNSNSSWGSQLVEKTGISSRDLVEPAKILSQLHRFAEQSKSNALFRKYSTSVKHQVSCSLNVPTNISSLFA